MPLDQIPLSEGDLPGVFKSADELSVSSQKQYLRWTRGRLQLAVSAAVSGVFSATSEDGTWTYNLFTTLALASFSAALLLEVYLLRDKPEERWYKGRALAESVKTLAWRYMAAADPFPLNLPRDRAEEVLLSRIRRLFQEASNDIPGLFAGETQVTTRMRQIREGELPSRKSTYLQLRVSDQRSWYERKAKENENSSKTWRGILVTCELIGIIATVVNLLDIMNVDVGAAFAAAIAAAGAWLEVKQYDNLASAYSLTAGELSFVYDTGASISDEEKWSEYVISAEQAISREHTMWLARRASLRAARGNE